VASVVFAPLARSHRTTTPILLYLVQNTGLAVVGTPATVHAPLVLTMTHRPPIRLEEMERIWDTEDAEAEEARMVRLLRSGIVTAS